jgi:hypothetical protein
MAVDPKLLKEQYDAHISAANPHKVTSQQIWGLDNVGNTSDTSKPVSSALQFALDKKMNVSDIYNSVTEDSTKDLTKLPWSAAQGYSMNNVIDAYQAQDTTELEARIKWCEDNV